MRLHGLQELEVNVFPVYGTLAHLADVETLPRDEQIEFGQVCNETSITLSLECTLNLDVVTGTDTMMMQLPNFRSLLFFITD